MIVIHLLLNNLFFGRKKDDSFLQVGVYLDQNKKFGAKFSLRTRKSPFSSALVFITLKLPSSPAARPKKIFPTLTKNISAGTTGCGQAPTSQTQANGQLMGNGANNNHNINR